MAAGVGVAAAAVAVPYPPLVLPTGGPKEKVGEAEVVPEDFL